jgi:hypothetical protein
MRKLQQSYEEYDPEKVEKRSKEFLKAVMGDEKFDNLQKNGKIEIEINNKRNEKTVYELYSDAKVINKTKNQSYCLVADRSDYPTNDIVAIKFAWLTHKSDIVEKVANRTNLYVDSNGIRTSNSRVSSGYADFVREMEQRGWNRQTINIGDSPYYGDYVDYMSGNGWTRELITIDELNPNFVSLESVQKGNTGNIIYIACPAGRKMSFMGKMQIPRGTDPSSAYSLGLYATDENGKEIPDDTKIRITKEKTSDYVIQLARVYYSDIKMKNGKAGYAFTQGIELNGEDYLGVFVVNANCNIPAKNIRFKIETDFWIIDA